MKKSIKAEKAYSEAFQNKMYIPVTHRQSLLNTGHLAEKIIALSMVDSGQSGDTSTAQLEIYVLPPDRTIKSQYATGYYVYDDWVGYLWYCETLKELLAVIKDYKVFIRKYVSEENNYLTIK